MSFKVERSRSSSNVDEKFFRISDYPPNANMDALKVKLHRYAGAIAVMIPCLTGQITVQMTLSSAIPSYIQVGDFKVYACFRSGGEEVYLLQV
ncbi:hypothetical protein DAPPUDRAFT_266069 [Daphnia pulex]|uniref:Uncharacterized protein n=1 Tax=Daphnia pulex TaxID=6669 RepID=E9HUF5_DAPPU|nr:hypothetical protein DAPPUDRAFT_266069 [Daphnia pulex]|eukprot:EFX64613.1 hypothetical protein DAPPUDRAFT_266069 [Daphnia pulex]